LDDGGVRAPSAPDRAGTRAIRTHRTAWAFPRGRNAPGASKDDAWMLVFLGIATGPGRLRRRARGSRVPRAAFRL